MTNINILDTKWQVSEHKPNKENLWSHPNEKDGWVLAHNMIRNEVDRFLHALQMMKNRLSTTINHNNDNNDNNMNNYYNEDGRDQTSWMIESMTTFWNHHQEVLHIHHSNEDDIVNPFLRQRVHLPPKLEKDHDAVINQMNVITNIVQKMKVVNMDSIQTLITSVEDYKTILFPHLLEEETIALPLLRSYFTPQEFAKPMGKVLRSSTKSELGSFINSMGVKTFRNVFMKQENIPSFVWYLKLKWDYNYYMSNVDCHLTALEDGVSVILSSNKRKAFFCRST